MMAEHDKPNLIYDFLTHSVKTHQWYQGGVIFFKKIVTLRLFYNYLLLQRRDNFPAFQHLTEIPILPHTHSNNKLLTLCLLL